MTFHIGEYRDALSCHIRTSIIVFLNQVMAHRSGCHRWHSCSSDSGKYIFIDTGYYCPDNKYGVDGNPKPSDMEKKQELNKNSNK